MHCTRSDEEKCVAGQMGGSFIIHSINNGVGSCGVVLAYVRSDVFCDDSEVSVEKHDEAYCVLQSCCGVVGTHKGLYRTRAGAV